MDALATATAILRALHLAASLSLLGTAGFMAWMLPASIQPNLRQNLNRLCWVSGVIALLAGTAWFTLQAAAIAGAEDLSDLYDALPIVALHTRFGHVLLSRLSLVLLATAASARSAHASVALAAVALCLQGFIGHAGATQGAAGDGLVVSEALHLLAAGTWLGALLPLAYTLRRLPPGQAALVCERFSPIGLACVLVLAGSGFIQGMQLIGGIPALLGTRYGQIALLKIALFLLALALAALNRLWLTDRLGCQARRARRHMLISLTIETTIGLAIVSAAAFMASSPPAAHTSPVWPFPWRFSLVTLNEDPDFRNEVLTSLAIITAAAALFIASLAWRRQRTMALLILAACLAWRGASFQLLLVQAYPTSFQTSPTGFAGSSIVLGQTLYAPNCARCHGTAGQGDGPEAGHLHIRPADLTMPHLWDHSDGELFWWLSHGIDDPEGGMAMPGFASTLSPDDIWSLIDYARALNIGVALASGQLTTIPYPSPDVAVHCPELSAATLHGLRGQPVQVIAPPPSGPMPINVQTVWLETDPSVMAGAGRPSTPFGIVQDRPDPQAPESCEAADPAAWGAFAILAGVPPGKMAGTQFLIDANGWMRQTRRPGMLTTGPSAAATEQYVRDHPLSIVAGDEHEHHH